jgi:chorismate synthase
VHILSGVLNNVTTGTPIHLLVWNENQRGKDYEEMKHTYRPSHADATYDAKYGVRAAAGGGRASARETIGRVAVGAVARQVLSLYSGVEIVGYVVQIHDVIAPAVDHDTVCVDMVSDCEMCTLVYVQTNALHRAHCVGGSQSNSLP